MENKNFTDAIKKFKAIGIVVSILIAICGVIIFTKPVGSGIFFVWLTLAGLFVNGIYKLITYFGFPKEKRNGWVLADGIISTLFSIFILASISATPIATVLEFIWLLMYFVGFYEIFIGIKQLFSVGAVKELGGSYGWIIFIGIVNIICGLFVAGRPIIAYFTFEWIMGIYLCIFGITTFIECLCIKK